MITEIKFLHNEIHDVINSKKVIHCIFISDSDETAELDMFYPVNEENLEFDLFIEFKHQPLNTFLKQWAYFLLKKHDYIIQEFSTQCLQ